MAKHYHPYHLVDPSPWPYFGSVSALTLTSGAVAYFQGYMYGNTIMSLGFIMVLLTMIFWWKDVIKEATFQGHHTIVVQKGLKYGMLLFIVSEVFFFFAFFWAFFHSSLAPAIELGAVWPPIGIQILDPFDVPLLNTAILLSSGATVTWAHHAILSNQRKEAILGLGATVALGVIFLFLQAYEYNEAPFTIADSVYGSTFYLATGFHGIHVLIGTIFLIVCFYRLINYHFTSHHHFGFEASAWYFHFCDYVWLFLYAFIYWWGSANL